MRVKRFGNFYRLRNGVIFGKRVLPNMRLASPMRYIETSIWKNIYRWLFK